MMGINIAPIPISYTLSLSHNSALLGLNGVRIRNRRYVGVVGTYGKVSDLHLN